MATRYIETDADADSALDVLNDNSADNVLPILYDQADDRLKYYDRAASAVRALETNIRRVITPLVSTTLTAADSGSVIVLTAVADMILTLPPPAAGLEYEFYSAGPAVTTSHYVVTDAAAAIIEGSVMVAGVVVPAANEKRINFIAAAVLPGDRAKVFSDGTSWFVSGDAAASGGITVTAP
jgi:hypothetical protein